MQTQTAGSKPLLNSANGSTVITKDCCAGVGPASTAPSLRTSIGAGCRLVLFGLDLNIAVHHLFDFPSDSSGVKVTVTVTDDGLLPPII